MPVLRKGKTVTTLREAERVAVEMRKALEECTEAVAKSTILVLLDNERITTNEECF